jgi:hypothetical protein
MISRRFIAMAVSFAIFVAASGIEVRAESAAQLQDRCGQALSKLEIIGKDSKGSLRLKEKAKRYEFIAFVNAMMCYEPVTEKDDAKSAFKDITPKHKGYDDIRTAEANDILEAYKDGTIKPDRIITYSEALQMLLKALGYGGQIKELDAKGIILLSDQLGLSKDAALTPEKQLTRGEASIIIYNALTVNFADVPRGE